PTVCFTNPHWNARVFAHTTGYGDSVLFEDLGPPWPVHPCYEQRFLFSGPLLGNISITQSIELAPPPPPQWHFVVEVQPERVGSRKTFNIVGSVTEVVPGAAKVLLEHPNNTVDTRAALRRILDGRLDRIRIVTGDGEAFFGYVSLKSSGVEFNDSVAATVKLKDHHGQKFFVVTNMKHWSVS